VILMLASSRPANAIWWTAGWTASTFATFAVVVLVLDQADPPGSRSHSTATCVVQVVLAIGLAAAAGVVWRRRPARSGKQPTEPRWMERIGELRPLVAFALGGFWINAAVVIAAAAGTVRADLSTASALTACALFAVVSGSAQAGILVVARLRPARSAGRLAAIRRWITINQHAAAAAVAAVLAVWLGVQGIAGLTG
jgi:Sap-like sulfolipid-1-addressing protein